MVVGGHHRPDSGITLGGVLAGRTRLSANSPHLPSGDLGPAFRSAGGVSTTVPARPSPG